MPHRLLLALSAAAASSTVPGACAFQTPAPLRSTGGSSCGLPIVAGGLRRSCNSSACTVGARRRTRLLDSELSEEPMSMESAVDLYDDEGQELDVRIALEDIEEDEFYSPRQDGEEIGDGDDGGDASKKRRIECSASILLPFSEEVAFDAFSDLTRQPSWCKYLHAVEYIGLVGDDAAGEMEIPLRSSKWTVGVKGLRFSWTANDTRIVRPHRIEWESTSGMKNVGSVEFAPQPQSSSQTATQMTLRFTFVTPRVVSSLFRRSGKIRKYTEEVLLMSMLEDFRDVVLEEDL